MGWCVIRDRAGASLLARARPPPCNATHRLPDARARANCHPSSHKSTHPCGVLSTHSRFLPFSLGSCLRRRAQRERQKAACHPQSTHNPPDSSLLGAFALAFFLPQSNPQKAKAKTPNTNPQPTINAQSTHNPPFTAQHGQMTHNPSYVKLRKLTSNLT